MAPAPLLCMSLKAMKIPFWKIMVLFWVKPKTSSNLRSSESTSVESSSPVNHRSSSCGLGGRPGFSNDVAVGQFGQEILKSPQISDGSLFPLVGSTSHTKWSSFLEEPMHESLKLVYHKHTVVSGSGVMDLLEQNVRGRNRRMLLLTWMSRTIVTLSRWWPPNSVLQPPATAFGER